MVISVKKRLVMVTVVYWFLLLYIIAALVWWFIALNNQNRQMTSYKLNELKLDDPAFEAKRLTIMKEKERKAAQYIGEGTTFLAFLLLGAVFLYRAVRRQIKWQQQEQDFMMAVTHELKTPVAVARLNLETLQKHQLEESRRQKLIQMTLEETHRLNALTSNILVSAQLESGRYNIQKEELDLSALTISCIMDFKQRFPERNWRTAIDEEIDMKGDALLLQILVNNLLENALKYSPKEGVITCSLHRHHHHILLSVTDQGPGIPDAEKKKIFGKFYRIGNEQTRTAKGTGLGLFMCRKIAADHRAQIRVTDNLPSGSTFTVNFTV